MNVVQTALLMGIFTLISKVLGFLREMVLANYFGTSSVTDAYVMAVAIPNIIFSGILTSVSTAYLPIYSKKFESQGGAEGNIFTSKILNLLITISLIAAFIGIFFSDEIIMIFASGFEGKTAALASYFVKVTFSFALFSSLAGILEAYLTYKNVFLPQIVAGYCINIFTIIGIVIGAYTNQYYIIFGLLAGHVSRFALIAYISKKNKYQYIFSQKINQDVKQLVLLSIPVFISSSLVQINAFVDKTLASNLKEGSVAALNYASLLNGLIIGLTIAILSTIIYPKLIQANFMNDIERFNHITKTGINLIFIITIPFSIGSILYHNQIVQIVYERGVFNSEATSLTSSAYAFYAIGLFFIALNEYLIRIYYSINDMKTPLKYSFISVIINIVLNFILIRYMLHNGLALATSIAIMVSSLMLFGAMKQKYPEIQIIESKKKIIKIIISAFFSTTASVIAYAAVDYMIWLPRAALLAIAVTVAILIYYALLKALKIEEIDLLNKIIKH